MPIDDKKLAALLKVILMLGSLFLLGLYMGARIGFLPELFSFGDSDFAIFFLPVKLFLLFIPCLFIYVVVSIFINYYFKEIGYNARLLLMLAGFAVFNTGITLL